MDLAYPQRSTNRGQGYTEIYTTLEIGQYFHRRASALICSPKHVAVYGELDRDEGGLPTLQYGSPEDQFMGSSSRATTKQFGISGNGTVVIFTISCLIYHINILTCKTISTAIGRRLNQLQG